jgi:hypothetical protein
MTWLETSDKVAVLLLMPAKHDTFFSYKNFRTNIPSNLLDGNMSYPAVNESVFFVGNITYHQIFYRLLWDNIFW